jgi:predicted nucleotidyltransferase component of viral defense system
MATQLNLRELAASIASTNGQTQMLPVIEKELIHFEILNALDTDGFLDLLTFQGGTCLRLCYGSQRYSEDLDFVCGTDMTIQDFRGVKKTIEQALSGRYAVNVVVSEPQGINLEEGNDITRNSVVEKWNIQVTMDALSKDIPRQRIKLEIAKIPSYTRVVKPLLQNYSELPINYADVLIFCESLTEIAADKLVSLAIADYIRDRDIWDLRWISRQADFTVNEIKGLVGHKVSDYHAEIKFDIGRKKILSELDDIIRSDMFKNQMMRFLPVETISSTLEKEKYLINMCDEIKMLYSRT